MRKENIHIVFGRARRTLIESHSIDLNTSHILSLDDNLNIGPVCDIQEKENIKKRKDWLGNTFDNTSGLREILLAVENDVESIKFVIENTDKIDKIFVWTGFFASEIISTARLIYHFSQLDKPIFIANYPNIPIKSVHGDTIYPKALVETATFQVKDVLAQFELIDNERFIYWISLWNKVKIEKGLLWILDDKGQISKEKVDYFDTFLVSNCNGEFQKAAKVIGETLVDTDFNVDDNYLNWRLKQLAPEEKIESQESLIEIKDYEVKKITAANVMGKAKGADTLKSKR
jgi:hypothetical protein